MKLYFKSIVILGGMHKNNLEEICAPELVFVTRSYYISYLWLQKFNFITGAVFLIKQSIHAHYNYQCEQSTFLHQWPFSHLTESFNHIKAVTHAPVSHYNVWPECGTGPVSWTQESRTALQGPGLCEEALMCCDRCACLSAFPWQRAAKSNANSQAARRAFCLIQFPPLLSQHSTTWKEPLFHIPLGLIALLRTWCTSF